MKLLIVGDLHLRTRTPKRRREADFAAVCLGKLRQVMDIAFKRSIDAVVQVGDFFDSPNPSKGLIAAVIEAIRGYDSTSIDWYTIHGQHDLAYHSEAARKSSALRVLDAALPEFHVMDGSYTAFTLVVGAGFGQEPPDNPNELIEVVAAHVMVGDKPLWPGHDLTGPEEYVRKHPGYRLYCLGDYHYPYSVKVGDAWVINPGCVLRLTASERDRAHRPKVVLFDMDGGVPEDIYLDVAPAEDAFDLEGHQDSQDAAERRASFAGMAGALRDSGKFGVNFQENLTAVMDKAATPEGVRNRIWDCWRRIELGE